jgi:ATP-binding cassette subfamily B protein
MEDITEKQQAVSTKKVRTSFWFVLYSFVQVVWRKRVRPLVQMTEVECGITCLAMILNYYGRPTSIGELRVQFGGGRDGLSALSIVKAARSYGLRVRAISLAHSEFRRVTLPAIIHWQFNHFLIVERWSKKWVSVVDPAFGRRRLSSGEFDSGFTGVVITLEPGVNFERRPTFSTVRTLSLKTYVQQFIGQAPGTILQILGASLLLQGLGLILPLLTKVVLDQILPSRMSNVMFALAVGMLLLLMAQATISILREWLLVYLRARIDIHMVLGSFEHLLKLPYSFFQQRSSGDLLARMSSNTVLRDTLSNQLISTMLDGSIVVIYLIILLWQSLPFGLLTLAVGVLQVILLMSTYHFARDLSNRELAAQGKSQGYLAEALAGIATLKAAGAEPRAFDRWSNLFFDQLNTSVRRSYLSTLVGTGLMTLRTFAPLALLWVGAMQVLNDSMTVGTMLALNTLAATFLAPLSSLVNSGQQLQLVQSHIERLADIMDSEAEQNMQLVTTPPKLTGSIQLEHVGFQYSPDAPNVLHDINVTIAVGQKVAIVGRTGSGKSTLGKLLLGLYVPTEGSVGYDGIPLRHLNYQDVRRQFGVVLQDAAIFSGSILQNIMLNDPEMSREKAVEAAKIASIHDDIMQMPMGYETVIAEGGSALSGGQRQRLAIARAIAHEPAILLMDEATSHLDVITEQKVAHNLQAFACTQIIIAHRLSTVRDADLVLVLDRGTIVEQGSHTELLQRGGYYTQLVQHQLVKEVKNI